jgi:hypothetical protein
MSRRGRSWEGDRWTVREQRRGVAVDRPAERRTDLAQGGGVVVGHEQDRRGLKRPLCYRHDERTTASHPPALGGNL